MPAITASSITWQDSVAKRSGGTTKQLLFETNGRARHLSSPPAMSWSIDTAGATWGASVKLVPTCLVVPFTAA